MSVSVELRPSLVFDDVVVSKLTRYFSDDGSGETISAQIRSRGSSGSSSEEGLTPDTEKEAGVEEWMPLIKDDATPTEPLLLWLTNCGISCYAATDFILLTNGSKLAFLRRTPSHLSNVDLAALKDVQELLDMTKEDYISASCLFGLGSLRQSEAVDCVIAAIGTSNGYVLFITEKGVPLFYEKFSPSLPVISLSFDQFEAGQTVTITTENEFFSVNPFSLHGTLMEAKTSIARKEKTVVELSETLEIECERLGIEKSRTRLNHLVCTGIQQPTTFQQYVNASLAGFNKRVERPSLPNYTTYFASSDEMFATFAWHEEGDHGSIWSDTVAKITTSLVPHFGFRKFLGIPSASDRKAVLSQLRRDAAARGVLDDARRVARVSRSPSPHTLLAVCDQSARVVLIDYVSRQIVRIWKAYRDAAVAWVTASHEGKSALFLVIFAPRRKLLEVWSLQNGPRVSAMHVDPEGILLNGGKTEILFGRSKTSDTEESTAFFVDSQGVVHEVCVPFHLCLFKGTSHEQHDQLIFTKITTALTSNNVENFVELFRALRTAKGRRQAVFALLDTCQEWTSDQLAFFLERIQKVLDRADPTGGLLLNVRRIQNLFDRLCGHWTNPVIENQNKEEKEMEIPFGEETMAVLQRHLSLKPQQQEDPEINTLRPLFACIDWHNETGALKSNLADVDRMNLAIFIFVPVLNRKVDVAELVDEVMGKLSLKHHDLCSLLSFFILNSRSVLGQEQLSILSEILWALSAPDSGVLVQVQNSALNSTNLSRALILYSATVAVKQRLKEKKDESLEEMDAITYNEPRGLGDDDDTRMDDSKSPDGWHEFDPETEDADVTVMLMHCGWLLSCVVGQRPALAVAKYTTAPAAVFREQIAWLATDRGLKPTEVDNLMEGEETLKELRQLLPHSLKDSLLRAEIAWELTSQWFRSRVDKSKNLARACEYLTLISDEPRLVHGLCRLIWDKFLVQNVKALSDVMEKTGRAPKDREAKQLLQMSDRHVLPFVSQSLNVLSLLLESVRDPPAQTSLAHDQLIEAARELRTGRSSGGTTRDSLAEIALSQRVVNYHLVLHHIHLLSVYRLQLATSQRLRLSQLFCGFGQRALFQPLDSHPLIPLEKVEDGLLENRHNFITKCAEDGGEQERLWARELATHWSLTSDSIAIAQALCRLRRGEDDAAMRELPTVIRDTSQMWNKLWRILAARILQLAHAENTVLTKSHTSYLSDLSGEESSRVEWAGDWREAVTSLGLLCRSLGCPEQSRAPFHRLQDIATRYWAIQWS